jgi:hypothetical protein
MGQKNFEIVLDYINIMGMLQYDSQQPPPKVVA